MILFCALSLPAFGLSIPKGLSISDQEDVTKILGLGTSMKMATNPYPLGGYSGFEIGYDLSFINIDQLTRLGCDPGSSGCANTARSEEQEFSYGKLTVGKGLYGNVDVFFSFAPLFGAGGVSDYGGSLRWTFYEAELLPIHILILASGNRVNFRNQFSAKNVGLDLLVGINVDDISVYCGGGQIRSEGLFIGGDTGDGTVPTSNPNLDLQTNTSSVTVQRFHTVVGASLEWKTLFVAGEINRYDDSVYTVKAGLRF
ncbi:MAG: hypothetical protein CL676_06605 [Bdellovibrionaceae bacterium]|nr:hypothetical protein [Pseudobdellovibrionaceae bacterium]